MPQSWVFTQLYPDQSVCEGTSGALGSGVWEERKLKVVKHISLGIQHNLLF